MSDIPKILLVDDDDDYAESIGSFLGAHGFSVRRGRNGKEGLMLARAERPDLVLMDVMMDERTEGFFTLQQMRRDPDLADVPVFVVSSIYSAIPGFRVSPEAGWLRHDDFLAKPVELDELLGRIRQRLAATSRDLTPTEAVQP
jgi:DNA-binding response OmpR family regulator